MTSRAADVTLKEISTNIKQGTEELKKIADAITVIKTIYEKQMRKKDA